MAPSKNHKKPNLFLIGPPKCGTTAFSEYLRAHPDVFFSTPKEPHFFSPEFKMGTGLKRTQDYLKLFQNAGSEKILAEASTHYLRSRHALERIQKFNPNAKFVAFVRNPIDLARSWHRQLLNMGEEQEPSFHRAWRLQEQRALGRELPAQCSVPDFLQYQYVASIGQHIQKLMTLTAPDKRHVIIMDDFKSNPEQTYRKLLDFLALPHDGRRSFPKFNQAFRYKKPELIFFIKKPPKSLRAVSNTVKLFNGDRPLGIYQRLDQYLDRRLRKSKTLEPIPQAVHDELADAFRDDVGLLSELLGRDFTYWLKTSRQDHKKYITASSLQDIPSNDG